MELRRPLHWKDVCLFLVLRDAILISMTSFAVSEGIFSALIGPRDALAIHMGARGVGELPVAVTFNEIANTTLGEVRMAVYLYHTFDF
jgi:hypothetical protein